jgi:hypothetical protein
LTNIAGYGTLQRIDLLERHAATVSDGNAFSGSQKQRETAKNSGVLAVISALGRSGVQDSRRKREVARCKFPARTAKTAGSSRDARAALDARGGA